MNDIEPWSDFMDKGDYQKYIAILQKKFEQYQKFYQETYILASQWQLEACGYDTAKKQQLFECSDAILKLIEITQEELDKN